MTSYSMAEEKMGHRRDLATRRLGPAKPLIACVSRGDI